MASSQGIIYITRKISGQYQIVTYSQSIFKITQLQRNLIAKYLSRRRAMHVTSTRL